MKNLKKGYWKRIISAILILTLVVTPVNVQAAHAHTADCYSTHNHQVSGCVQHAHTGDAGLGTGCYTLPVYHTHTASCPKHQHTGSSTAGGGCYTVPVGHAHTDACGYHTHTGDTTNGGACYATPVYHTHTSACGVIYFPKEIDSFSITYGYVTATSREYCYVNINYVDGTSANKVMNFRPTNTTLGYYYYGDAKNLFTNEEVNFMYDTTVTRYREVIYLYNEYKVSDASIATSNPIPLSIFKEKLPFAWSNLHLLGYNSSNATYQYGSCGKTTSTIESYQFSCSLAEGYQCGKENDFTYKLGCGKTTDTYECNAMSQHIHTSACGQHWHTGDSTNGGGCYGKANYHQHTAACYGTLPLKCDNISLWIERTYGNIVVTIRFKQSDSMSFALKFGGSWTRRPGNTVWDNFAYNIKNSASVYYYNVVTHDYNNLLSTDYYSKDVASADYLSEIDEELLFDILLNNVIQNNDHFMDESNKDAGYSYMASMEVPVGDLEDLERLLPDTRILEYISHSFGLYVDALHAAHAGTYIERDRLNALNVNGATICGKDKAIESYSLNCGKADGAYLCGQTGAVDHYDLGCGLTAGQWECGIVEEQSYLHTCTGSTAANGGCYTTPVYHTHTAACGTHTHEGSTSAGGACYQTPVYHAHTGSTTAGGGCYTTKNYHSHSGSSTSGGGCYGTPVYHTHGDECNAYVGDIEYIRHSNDFRFGLNLNGENDYDLYIEFVVSGTYNQEVQIHYTSDIGYTLIITDSTVLPKYYDYQNNLLYAWRDAMNAMYALQVNTGSVFLNPEDLNTVDSKLYSYVLEVCRTYFCRTYDDDYTFFVPLKTKTYTTCDKSTSVVESYAISCGKTTSSVDSYSLGCGKTTSTVVSYTKSCTRSEGYQCGKTEGVTADSWAKSCGKESGKYYTAAGAEVSPLCDVIVTSIAPVTISTPYRYMHNQATATATYLDGHTSTVNVTTNYDPSTATVGSKTYTATYTGRIDKATSGVGKKTANITIKTVGASSFTLKNKKQLLRKGQIPDYTGTAKYDSLLTLETASNVTSDFDATKTGQQTVTVTYNGGNAVTDTMSVYVPAEPMSISASTVNTTKGTDANVTLKVKLEDGTTVDRTFKLSESSKTFTDTYDEGSVSWNLTTSWTNKNVGETGTDYKTGGEYVLKVNYNGITTNVNVNVTDTCSANTNHSQFNHDKCPVCNYQTANKTAFEASLKEIKDVANLAQTSVTDLNNGGFPTDDQVIDRHREEYNELKSRYNALLTELTTLKTNHNSKHTELSNGWSTGSTVSAVTSTFNTANSYKAGIRDVVSVKYNEAVNILNQAKTLQQKKVTINNFVPQITVTGTLTKTYDQKPVTWSSKATVADFEPADFVNPIKYFIQEGTTWKEFTGQLTQAGSYTLKAVTQDTDYLKGEKQFSVVINPATLTATYSGQDKVYDGNDKGTVTLTLQGILSGDKVSTDAVACTYPSKNVGSNLTMTPNSTITLKGAQAHNYKLTQPTIKGTITKKQITTSYADQNKVYDGNTAIDLDLSLTGVVSGDDVSTSSGDAKFATKNVGTDISITLDNTYKLVGSDAGNYKTTLPTLKGNITKKPLDITWEDPSKIYDGRNEAEVAFALDGIVNGDQVITNYGINPLSMEDSGNQNFGVGSFETSEAGEDITVNLSENIELMGDDSSNYSLTESRNSGRIVPKQLTITYTNQHKVYDGTDNIELEFTLTGIQAGDDVRVSSGKGHFSQSDVGNDIPITFDVPFTISGADAANYVYDVPMFKGNILPKTINVTYGNQSKVYDAKTAVTLAFELNGAVAGDDVKASSGKGNYQTKNVGTNIVIALDTPFTLKGADAGNYTVELPAFKGDILQKSVNILYTGQNKIYDGTRDVELDIEVSGIIYGDNASPSSGVGLYSTKNVEDGKLITLNTPFSLVGTDAGNYKYDTPVFKGNITKKNASVSYSGQDKTYDSTTKVNIQFAFNNLVSGDDVGATSGSGNYSQADVGEDLPITLDTAFQLIGADANNYEWTIPSFKGSITPKELTLQYGNNTKKYDSTKAIQLTFNLSGIVGNDDVTPSSGNGAFVSENVGTDVRIILDTPFTLLGTKAHNYTVNVPDFKGSIYQKEITMSYSGQNKVYDSTDKANLKFELHGVSYGDHVMPSDGSGKYATENAGENILITLDKPFKLEGNDAANYMVQVPEFRGEIEKKPVEVTYSDNNKVYDGNTDASLKFELSGIVEGDDITTSSGQGNYASKNVGISIPITLSETFKLLGDDASNYEYDVPDFYGDITKKEASVVYTGHDKAYDGTDKASLDFSFVGVVEGDDIVATSGEGKYNQIDVGDNLAITLDTPFKLSGSDIKNYSWTIPDFKGSISYKELKLLYSNQNKVYDGTKDVTLEFELEGVAEGDSVGPSSGKGVYLSENVGTDIRIVLDESFKLVGSDAHNYRITVPEFKGNITKKEITVTYSGQDKVYDSSDAANLEFELHDVVYGDHVFLSSGVGRYADEHVGEEIEIILDNPFTLHGLDAANYSMQVPEFKGAITKKPIEISYSNENKVYDGNADTNLSFELVGIVGGDDVVSTSGAGKYITKNATNNIVITLDTPFALLGSDAINYEYTLPTLKGNITKKEASVVYSNQNKTYDGTNKASLEFSLVGIVEGDDVSTTSGLGTYSQSDIGNDFTITLDTPFRLEGLDVDNYAWTIPEWKGSILKKAVRVIYSGQDKVYDTTKDVTLEFTLEGIVPGDTVTTTKGNGWYTSKNVGNDIRISLEQPFTLLGVDAQNYSVDVPDFCGDITPKELTLTYSNQDKIYDSTDRTELEFSLAGIFEGDIVYPSSGAGTYETENVGTDIAITLDSPFKLKGFDAANYYVTAPDFKGNISQKQLELSYSDQDKIYDSNTAIELMFSLSGIVDGDDVQPSSGAGTYAFKDVGEHVITLDTPFALQGSDAPNYKVTVPELKGTISKKDASVSYSNQDKIYDGNNKVNLEFTLNDIVAGDDLTTTSGEGTYSQKEIGINLPITLDTPFKVLGADATNYNWDVPAWKGNITKKELVLTYTGQNKEYDSTDNAELEFQLEGIAQNDDVYPSSGIGKYATKNVGDDIRIVLDESFQLLGTDAHNYSVTVPDFRGDITLKEVTVTYSNQDKIYDSTDEAELQFELHGIIDGDNVFASSGKGTYETENVGTDIPITLDIPFFIMGLDAANYSVTAPDFKGNITQKQLELSYSDQDKIYDSNTAVELAFELSGIVDGDDIRPSSGVGTYASKNVGTDIPITLNTPFALQGADAANYKVTVPELKGTISKKDSTILYSGEDKIYDGNNKIEVAFELVDIVDGDDVQPSSGAGTYASKDVGEHDITLNTPFRFLGSDAGNYNYEIPVITGEIIGASSFTLNNEYQLLREGEMPDFTGTVEYGDFTSFTTDRVSSDFNPSIFGPQVVTVTYSGGLEVQDALYVRILPDVTAVSAEDYTIIKGEDKEIIFTVLYSDGTTTERTIQLSETSDTYTDSYMEGDISYSVSTSMTNTVPEETGTDFRTGGVYDFTIDYEGFTDTICITVVDSCTVNSNHEDFAEDTCPVCDYINTAQDQFEEVVTEIYDVADLADFSTGVLQSYVLPDESEIIQRHMDEYNSLKTEYNSLTDTLDVLAAEYYMKATTLENDWSLAATVEQAMTIYDEAYSYIQGKEDSVVTMYNQATVDYAAMQTLKEQKVAINNFVPVITIEGTLSKVYDGQPVSWTASATVEEFEEDFTNEVIFFIKENSGWQPLTYPLTEAGSYVLNAVTTDTDYLIGEKMFTVDIEKRPVTVSTERTTSIYGEIPVLSYVYDGLVNGETALRNVNLWYEIPVTKVGEQDVLVHCEVLAPINYAVTAKNSKVEFYAPAGYEKITPDLGLSDPAYVTIDGVDKILEQPLEIWHPTERDITVSSDGKEWLLCGDGSIHAVLNTDGDDIKVTDDYIWINGVQTPNTSDVVYLKGNGNLTVESYTGNIVFGDYSSSSDIFVYGDADTEFVLQGSVTVGGIIDVEEGSKVTVSGTGSLTAESVMGDVTLQSGTLVTDSYTVTTIPSMGITANGSDITIDGSSVTVDGMKVPYTGNSVTLNGNANVTVDGFVGTISPNGFTFGDMTVSGSSNVTVEGSVPVVFTGSVTVDGNSSVVVKGNTTIRGDLTVDNGKFEVDHGDCTVNGSVIVDNGGNVMVKGDLTVDGFVTANKESSIVTREDLNVEGDVTITENSSVISSADTVLGGDLLISMGSSISTAGNAEVAGDITVSHNSSMTTVGNTSGGKLVVTNHSSVKTEDLTINGDILANASTIIANGITNVTGNVVSGNGTEIKFNDNVTVQGDIDIEVNSTVTINPSTGAQIGGDVTVNSDSNFTVTSNASLTIGGTINANNGSVNLENTKDTMIGGVEANGSDITITDKDKLTIENGVTINGGSSADVNVKGNDNTIGGDVIVGSDSSIAISGPGSLIINGGLGGTQTEPSGDIAITDTHIEAEFVGNNPDYTGTRIPTVSVTGDSSLKTDNFEVTLKPTPLINVSGGNITVSPDQIIIDDIVFPGAVDNITIGGDGQLKVEDFDGDITLDNFHATGDVIIDGESDVNIDLKGDSTVDGSVIVGSDASITIDGDGSITADSIGGTQTQPSGNITINGGNVETDWIGQWPNSDFPDAEVTVNGGSLTTDSTKITYTPSLQITVPDDITINQDTIEVGGITVNNPNHDVTLNGQGSITINGYNGSVSLDGFRPTGDITINGESDVTVKIEDSVRVPGNIVVAPDSSLKVEGSDDSSLVVDGGIGGTITQPSGDITIDIPKLEADWLGNNPNYLPAEGEPAPSIKVEQGTVKLPDVSIEIKPDGNISIDSAGDVAVNGDTATVGGITVTVKPDSELTLKGEGGLTVENFNGSIDMNDFTVNGDLTIKDSDVTLKKDDDLTIEGNVTINNSNVGVDVGGDIIVNGNTSISGSDVIMKGDNITLNGDVTVDGESTLGTNSNKDTVINGNLTTNNGSSTDMEVGGNLTVEGNVTTDKNSGLDLNVKEDVIISGGVTSNGGSNTDVNAGGNLNVGGDITADSESTLGTNSGKDTNINGDISINGGADATIKGDNVTVNGDVTVDGNSGFHTNTNQNTTIKGDVTTNNGSSTDMEVGGNLTVEGNVTTDKNSGLDVNVKEDVIISGGVTSNGGSNTDVNAGGNLNVDGDVTADGDSILGTSSGKDTIINGNTSINGGADATIKGDNVTVNGNVTVEGESTLGTDSNKDTTIKGDVITNNGSSADVGVGGNLNVGGNVTTDNKSDLNLNVKEDITINGDVVTNNGSTSDVVAGGNASVNGDITTGGSSDSNVNTGGDLTVGGDVTTNGSSTSDVIVGGNTSIGGDVTVEDNSSSGITSGSDLNVGGDVTINGDSSSDIIVGGDTTITGGVTIQGGSSGNLDFDGETSIGGSITVGPESDVTIGGEGNIKVEGGIGGTPDAGSGNITINGGHIDSDYVGNHPDYSGDVVPDVTINGGVISPDTKLPDEVLDSEGKPLKVVVVSLGKKEPNGEVYYTRNESKDVYYTTIAKDKQITVLVDADATKIYVVMDGEDYFVDLTKTNPQIAPVSSEGNGGSSSGGGSGSISGPSFGGGAIGGPSFGGGGTAEPGSSTDNETSREEVIRSISNASSITVKGDMVYINTKQLVAKDGYKVSYTKGEWSSVIHTRSEGVYDYYEIYVYDETAKTFKVITFSNVCVDYTAPTAKLKSSHKKITLLEEVDTNILYSPLATHGLNTLQMMAAIMKDTKAEVTYPYVTNKKICFTVSDQEYGTSGKEKVEWQAVKKGKKVNDKKWKTVEGEEFFFKPKGSCQIYVRLTDKAGNETILKTSGFRKDKKKPTLKMNGWVIQAEDKISGVKKVTVDEKEVKKDYRFKEPGMYIVKVYDKAGNVLTKKVNIMEDHTKPDITVKNNKVMAEDSHSGIKELTVNGKKVKYGFKLKSKGTYIIAAKDKAGNETVKTVTVK